MSSLRRLTPLPLLLPLLLAGGSAAAQVAGGGGGPSQAPAPVAAAPALPGLAARRAPAPIPSESTAALSPNAALFDAVARGDLAAARDAVARGANLEARNELGLTALDAAVDRGRHDIAFYLLSARDLSRRPAPAVLPPGGLGGPPPAAAAGVTPRVAAAPARRAPDPAATQPAVPRNARLWASDGGAPRPEMGFLGFDAGRPAGAQPPGTARTSRRD